LDVVRDEGPTLVQSFHESAAQRGGKFDAILADLCAFANTAGGVAYIGAGPGKDKLRGLNTPAQAEQEIRRALDERMTPRFEVKIDTLQSGSAKVLRVQVAKGLDLPYALDANRFYVRDEAETTLAVRDEIVALVREALGFEPDSEEPPPLPESPQNAPETAKPARRPPRKPPAPTQPAAPTQPVPKQPVLKPVPKQPAARPLPQPVVEGSSPTSPTDDTTFYLPQVGVEIVDNEERNGHRFYTIRDLRNGHVIKNVTRKGARKLWSYAIQQAEDRPVDPAKIEWRQDTGFVRMERRAGKMRYDLALREKERIRIFYGVTDDGMDGVWAQFLQDE
jgi:hypothetical protein